MKELETPILVDCDGILSNFTQACLDLAAEKFNVFALPEDCNKDPLWDAIGCPYLPPAIDDAIRDREFVYRMKPLPGALDFLRTLENTYGKDNIEICTAPWNSQWAEQRYDWLNDIAKIPAQRVHMTKRKYRIPGILVDDTLKHLKPRKDNQAFCIAHPYNTEWTGPRGNYQDCLKWLEGVIK